MQQQSNNKCIWAFNACGLTLARKQDGPEHLIEETDHFLEEQAVVSSNGTPFKDVVRKNRLLIARCKSALDRVMDDTTRRQVCPLDALSPSLSLFLSGPELCCFELRLHALGPVGAELLLYSPMRRTCGCLACCDCSACLCLRAGGIADAGARLGI